MILDNNFTTINLPPDIHYKWTSSESPYLEKLRKVSNLAPALSKIQSSIEKVIHIQNWVHTLWEHDGYNQPQKSDPISIIEKAKKGHSFRCVEYSRVLSAVLAAFGFKARCLSLMREDVETAVKGAGHVVVEVYLEDFNKWCFLDPQANVTVFNGAVPLNANEIHTALKEPSNPTNLELGNQHEDFNKDQYFKWIEPYLFYLAASLDNRVENKNSFQKLMYVPPHAKEPKVFQKIHLLEGISYTRSLEHFYSPPL